jgi:spermidine synthase
MSRRPRDRSRPARVVTAGGGVVELVADPRRQAGRMLIIDGLASSYVDLDDPAYLHLDYLHRLGAALDVLLPRSAAADVLHLGGGGFALPRFLATTRPQVRQVVYEIEPAVVEVARRHLRLRRSAALSVRVGDARAALERLPAAGADAVVGDAFVGTEVPAHLSTVEFASIVRSVLRPKGAYLLNVVDAPPLTVARTHAATLRAAFDHVVVFGERGVVSGRRAGNVLLAASASPLPLRALEQRLATSAHPAVVIAGDALGAFTGGAGPLRDGQGD